MSNKLTGEFQAKEKRSNRAGTLDWNSSEHNITSVIIAHKNGIWKWLSFKPSVFSHYRGTGLLNFKSEAARNEGCQRYKITRFWMCGGQDDQYMIHGSSLEVCQQWYLKVGEGAEETMRQPCWVTEGREDLDKQNVGKGKSWIYSLGYWRQMWQWCHKTVTTPCGYVSYVS